MGTLFLVATPIGNLEDLSLRAIKTLKQVQLIAAEDTRHTHKLLEHYEISTPTISYHEHNKISRLDEILSALSDGDVALVSDAGTPALNDPGYELVRGALEKGHSVSPVPGPNAPIAALVASGLPTDAFLYLGYFPRKKVEQTALLQRFAGFEHTMIFLESPHRLVNSLRSIYEFWGDRQIAVARELTKLYEEIFRGQVSAAIEHYSNTGVRGEICLVIAGEKTPNISSEEDIQGSLLASLKKGIAPRQAAAEVSAISGWPPRKLYQMILTLQSKNQDSINDT